MGYSWLLESAAQRLSSTLAITCPQRVGGSGSRSVQEPACGGSGAWQGWEALPKETSYHSKYTEAQDLCCLFKIEFSELSADRNAAKNGSSRPLARNRGSISIAIINSFRAEGQSPTAVKASAVK